MKFTWDPKKNRTNKRDHEGFDFPLASLVFNDPRCLVEFDQIDEYGEERLLGIGRLPNGLVLVVVHIERGHDENGEEIRHIISARKADHGELERYFQQAAD